MAYFITATDGMSSLNIELVHAIKAVQEDGQYVVIADTAMPDQEFVIWEGLTEDQARDVVSRFKGFTRPDVTAV